MKTPNDKDWAWWTCTASAEVFMKPWLSRKTAVVNEKASEIGELWHQLRCGKLFNLNCFRLPLFFATHPIFLAKSEFALLRATKLADFWLSTSTEYDIQFEIDFFSFAWLPLTTSWYISVYLYIFIFEANQKWRRKVLFASSSFLCKKYGKKTVRVMYIRFPWKFENDIPAFAHKIHVYKLDIKIIAFIRTNEQEKTKKPILYHHQAYRIDTKKARWIWWWWCRSVGVLMYLPSSIISQSHTQTLPTRARKWA